MIGAFFFNCFLWIMGITVLDERPEERLQARGKCREIVAEKEVVKIKFNNPEDAEIFAADLKEFINNR